MLSVNLRKLVAASSVDSNLSPLPPRHSTIALLDE